MDKLTFHETPLKGLRLVESSVHADARGQFERVFCSQALAALHPGISMAQSNLSTTIGPGSIRGLHYQKAPALEAKLVRCLSGQVFDVAVDLRAGSATFLKWHAVRLSETEPLALFIPEGFAHGFQVLSDRAQLLYFHSVPWTAACEGGIRFNDPALAVDWPLPATTVSERDRSHALLDSTFSGIAR